MNNRILAAICAILLLLSLACAAPAELELPKDAPCETALPPTPTPAPTPKPTPTPSPAPTPMIRDAWYRERTAAMRQYLACYGGYSCAALEEKVREMEIDPDKPMIALTFDDGPVAGVTDAILDILAQYNARATFFVLGWRLKKDGSTALLEKILGEGCEIGNHTYEHLLMDKASGYQIVKSLEKVNVAVKDATGYTVRLLRPPGGCVSAEVNRYAERFGLSVVLWTQSGNVHEKDPEKIAENVERQIVNGKELHDGDIVLLHDTNARMVEAVSILVPRLLEKGYQLVTVSELLSLSERGLVPGVRYYAQNPTPPATVSGAQ